MWQQHEASRTYHTHYSSPHRYPPQSSQQSLHPPPPQQTFIDLPQQRVHDQSSANIFQSTSVSLKYM